MTEVPSKPRCYPVKYCAECQGRLPMRHLYKPYGAMSHHNIVDVDSEFANRWVCTETDDNREIKLHPSLDFPDWCPLKVISDDPIKPAQQKDNDPDFHTLNNNLGRLINLVNGLSDDIEADAINENRTIRRRLETLERGIWGIRDTIRPFDRFDDVYNNWQESHDAAIRNAILDDIILKCNSEIQYWCPLFEDKDRYGRLKANYLIRDYCESLRSEITNQRSEK